MSDWWDLIIVCYVVVNDNLGSKWKIANLIRKIKNEGRDDDTQISSTVIGELVLNLPKENISNFSTTKPWKILMNDDEFWKTMCDKEHFYEQAGNLKSKLYAKFLKKYPINEQALYMYNQTVRDNWSNDNFTITNVRYHFHQLHHFDDEEIIASSCTDLFVLDSSTGTVKYVFPITRDSHIKVVSSEDFLVAYFESGDFLVFDRHTEIFSNFCVGSAASNIRENSLKLHGKGILFITVSGNFKIFRIKNNVIEYEQAGVTCACVHENVIILGTKESIQFLDVNYNVLRSQTCCEGKTTVKMEVVDEYLINLCGSSKMTSCDICVWNIQTESKLTSITGMSSNSVFVLDNNKIACQKAEETKPGIFEVWNFLTGQHLFTIDDSGNNPIINVLSNHHFIFTVSKHTKCIKMWCPKTGSFLKFLNLETDFLYDNFCKPTDTKFVYLRCSPSCLSKSLCMWNYDNEEKISNSLT